MPETDLCLKGKEPKMLSYIDEKESQYIVLICKLKDNITELKLRSFFNMIYSVKLDSGYTTIFAKQYSTMNLINCLKSILKEKKEINLKGIYDLLNKGQDINIEPLELVFDEFWNMFEMIDKRTYPIQENVDFITNNDIPTNSSQAMLLYNSYIMDLAERKNNLVKKRVKKVS